MNASKCEEPGENGFLMKEEEQVSCQIGSRSEEGVSK